INETVINDIEIVTPEESTAPDTDAGVEIDAQAIPETDANADGGADANAGAGADEALIETVGERATEPLPVDLGATNGSPQGNDANDVGEANTVSGLRDDGAILQQETLAPQTTEHETTEPETAEPKTTEPEIASDDNNSEKAQQAEAPALNLEGRATPAMWRVSDDDSELWLLGTFHILPPELDWRSDPLARAVDAAEKIYFEAEVDAPEAQKKTLELLTTEGFLPDGGSLRAMLSAQDAEKFEEIIAGLGLPMGQLDRMRPWQAFLIMSVQHIVAQGFTPGAGVEAVLLKEARLRGRALGFFETAEQQIRLFTSLEPKTE
ncbi:MAG: TraB/GumN family protein, partial [Pseudomonadota bacterium]